MSIAPIRNNTTPSSSGGDGEGKAGTSSNVMQRETLLVEDVNFVETLFEYAGPPAEDSSKAKPMGTR